MTQLGRPPLIDRNQIIEASLRLGIDKLSMHAVARALGVSTTALYRYVRSKDELITLCMDTFCERLEVPSATHWRVYLDALARSFFEVLLAMPGAADYGARLGPSTPAAYRIVDRSMTILKDAGFGAQEAWIAYATTVNLAFDSARRIEQYATMPTINDKPAFAIYSLGDEELASLPGLSWSLDSEMPERDTLFQIMLDCVLDGLEHRHEEQLAQGSVRR